MEVLSGTDLSYQIIKVGIDTVSLNKQINMTGTCFFLMFGAKLFGIFLTNFCFMVFFSFASVVLLSHSKLHACNCNRASNKSCKIRFDFFLAIHV